MEALLQHPAVRRLAEFQPTASGLWLVGGCVRDLLLGRGLSSDFDVVLEGNAPAVAEALWAAGIADFPPVTYPRFGTAMVHILGVPFEFVTARRESYEVDSRKPEVEPATLLEDAQRRDFTCNTLMVNVATGELRDPLGVGLRDLRAGVLRTPVDPTVLFSEDPLRILRVVRFQAQLGFEVDQMVKDAIPGVLPRLGVISMERIRDEFSKMMRQGRRATVGLRAAMELGILDVFLPEARALVGVEQGKWHFLDVWDHTLLVIENADTDDLVLALGCLFHDIAKPATRLVDAHGQTRFFGHEVEGAHDATRILRRMKYSNDVIDGVHRLVKNHMRLGTATTLSGPAARRLVRDLGPHLHQLVKLVEADAGALRPGVRAIDMDAVRQKLAEVQLATPIEKLRSPLSGEQVMELLGLEPGKGVGRAMRFLTNQVIEGNLNPDDSAEAERMLKAWAATQLPAP